MRRIRSWSLAIVVTALLVLATPMTGPASAHAIIELNGVSAVAGHSSVMTLEIQHGCLPADPTVQVQAFVGKPWRSVSPTPVPGWISTVTAQPIGGWHITWVNTGAPVPFGTPIYVPMTVSWPAAAGVYAMTVLQVCPGSSNLWNTPNAPATANSPSPPMTPRAEVRVLAQVPRT